jgi:hypothetical protein
MMISEIGVYYFIAIFVSHQKQIAQIYVDLSDFDNFEKPQNFDKENKRLMFLSKMFIDFAIINVCLSPFITKRFCEKQNQDREFKEICGLLATTWMPFNIDVFPTKQIFFLWQSYTIVFTMKGAALISFAMMETIEYSSRSAIHCDYLLCFSIGKTIDKYYTRCLFIHVLLTGALFGCIGYRFMEVNPKDRSKRFHFFLF